MVCSVIELCRTLCDPMDCSPSGSSVHRHSPGKNSGVGSHALPVQVIFPTQGSNPGLPHYRQLLYELSHQGSPRILEWVAYPFSRESSWPRNWTGFSSIVGGFFTSWAIREAQSIPVITLNLSLLFCWYTMRIVMTFCHIELLCWRQSMVHLIHLTQWVTHNKHSVTFTKCIP